MTLIIILIALGLDYFLGGLERFRNYGWFLSLYYWLEKRLAHFRYWDGSLGIIGLMSIPIVTVLVVICYLHNWLWFAEPVFVLLILIYCLSPEDLDNRLDDYIEAKEEDDETAVAELTEQLIDKRLIDDEDSDESAIIKSSLVESHKRTFAVIFWFLILGVAGAVLYRLVEQLNKELGEIHSGFADSTVTLLNILEWPSSRIMIIALALAGHLGDALPGWGKAEHLSFSVNNDVLIRSGLGALQYKPDSTVPEDEKAYWIDELKALLNRALIICLAILAIMTLSGKLG